jgi:hypothetical protein
MANAEKIHPVARRDGIDYWRETACPACEAPVFVLVDEPGAAAVDDLESFRRHVCAPAFPVDLGKIAPEAVAEFRAGVEAAFGKKLVRFPGVFRRKGLPIFYTPEWKPFLGHVPVFSKSDVHRELNATAAVFALALPHVQKHFTKGGGSSMRKYFFSAKGVTKHERAGSRRVILWKWPRP